MSIDRRTTGYRLAYTTDDLAAATGLQVRHIRALIRRGELPAFRAGKKWLIRTESFAAWAERQERRAGRVA